MSEPQSSRTVVVHRVRAREPWVIATFAALLVPTVIMSIAVAIQPLLLLAAMWGSYLLAGWLLLVMSLWKRTTRLDADKTAQRARASSRGLFVDGGPALPREAIVAAFVSPSSPNGAYVRVHRRGGFPVELWTADVDGAHSLVAGLGLDATRVVGIARGAPLIPRPALLALVGLLCCGVGLAIVTWAPMLMPLIGLLAFAFAAVAMASRKIVVGTDGVVVSWLGRRLSFTPLAEIAAVEQLSGVVRLRLRSGEHRDLVIATRLGDRAQSIGMQVSLLAERIRRAMRRAGPLEIDASALERGPREISAWVASLRDLARASGYRAAVQREDLVSLAEDAHVKPTVRIAAAVALGAADEHERARLRIAAESSSLPEVSEAIEAVLGGDDPRLLAALKRVDQH